jgi:energy-coupling factor transporter ATP-binding protein EcfA2
VHLGVHSGIHQSVNPQTPEGDAPQRDSVAHLWAPADSQPEEPPAISKIARLPLGELSWENTERLFLRLLAEQGDVQWSKLFGTRGQDQEGIDAYARLTMAEMEETQLSGQPPQPRPYAVLQSRRVRKLAPSDIANAVEDFLAGSWGPETSTFYYATSFDLADTRLDRALRAAADRLSQNGVRFVPWGADEVNAMLRSKPELVDDFFGRAWVEFFCGADALASIRTRLPFHDLRGLREQLSSLYSAVFDSQSAIRRSVDRMNDEQHTGEARAGEGFVVLDVAPRPTAALGDVSWLTQASPGFHVADAPATDHGKTTDAPGSVESPEQTVTPSQMARPRRSLRSIRYLLETEASTAADRAFREPSDTWLSDGKRNLLIGEAGSGKSSLLRFIAMDLLSAEPQSAAIQQAHGGRLPVWLPFGFLCRHLNEAQGHSLTTAIRTWLNARDAAHLWPVVERALEDDRLLLLIDGIDEWTSRESANIALDSIETFLSRTDAAAFMTSRPYAVRRLASALTWRQGHLAPLDDAQRRKIAGQYLAPTYSSGDERLDPLDAVQTGPLGLQGQHDRSSRRLWNRANVEPFLAEVTVVPELSMLARTPLFLALLATTWRGEPLPPRRYELYSAIVDLLIERHPQMRRRSSRASDLPMSERDFKSTIEAVAYSLRREGNVGPIPAGRMRRLLREALSDDDVVGYSPDDARRLSDSALQMAEDEFGLIVPQGADHVGFVHRVVLDQLAGQRIAKLEISDQVEIFRTQHSDPAWADVLLAALAAQPNPPTVALILDAVWASSSRSGMVWPHEMRQEEGACELLAAAIAAEVELSPRKINQYLDVIVSRVERSPSIEHRATLITSLVKAVTRAGIERRLLPTFKRWLNASRPFPVAALFSLKDLPLDDDRVADLLIRGMRSDSGEVRAAAATSFAQRFGSASAPSTKATVTDIRGTASRSALSLLIDLVRVGPKTTTQAAAILAMGLGWPEEPEMREHLEWARRQSRTTLRTTAVYLTMKQDPESPLSEVLTDEEIQWVLAGLRDERHSFEHTWTRMDHELVARAASETVGAERAKLTGFVLETLSTNGRTGGNRELSWLLACTTFSDVESIRDWVIRELEDSEHPLVLYSIAMIPDEWREHPPMRRALASHFQKKTQDFDGAALDIASSLPRDEARAWLLQSIDGFRPWAAVSHLVQHYADDAEVLSILRARFDDDSTALRLAPVALEVLGLEIGFVRLFALLVASIEQDSPVRGTDQVVLTRSVATAWRHIREVAEGLAVENTTLDAERTDWHDPRAQAVRLRSAYSDAEVCRACTTVNTTDLGWHIGEIVSTWPDLTIDYALQALENGQHAMEGVEDRFHSEVLRVHADRIGPGSKQVMDAALEPLVSLEPELREVLAHELCSIGLEPAPLLEVLSGWRRDTDNGVRRTVVVGITQALMRAQRISHALGFVEEIEDLSEWRRVVREQLCSYGPSMEENRQNAWIAMLLLGDINLLQGLYETIGEPREPGVRLTDLSGTPDSLLVELVVANWDALMAHLGDQWVVRLSGGKPTAGEPDSTRAIEVAGALALAAGRHPHVAELIRRQSDIEVAPDIGRDPANSQGTTTEQHVEPHRPGDRLSLNPGVIDWRLSQNGITPTGLRLVLQASDRVSARQRSDQVRRWALSHLLDENLHELHAGNLREVLVEGLPQEELDRDDAWRHDHGHLRRSVFALLFPQDETTMTWLAGLARWFERAPRQSHGPSSWLEVAALCLGAAPAVDLPAIIGRIFQPGRLEYVDDSLWETTVPLLYRLRHDHASVEALRSSLSGEPVPLTSPFFHPANSKSTNLNAGQGSDRSARKVDDQGRRVFVTALALSHSGHLSHEDLTAAMAAMRQADPRTVVVDPFVNQVGPLMSLASTLLRV